MKRRIAPPRAKPARQIKGPDGPETEATPQGAVSTGIRLRLQSRTDGKPERPLTVAVRKGDSPQT